MAYKSFTIYNHKKKPGSYRIEYTGERHDNMGLWESSGSFCELIAVPGYLVMMKMLTTPVAVFKDLDHFCRDIEKSYGIKPEIK